MVDTPNIGLGLPDEADNIDEEIYRLRDNLRLLDAIIGNLQGLVAGKAATVHTHTLAQIDGLVEALAGKMSGERTFALADLTDVVGSNGAPAGYIFSKNAEGKYAFISAAAAIGNHQHVVPDIIDFDTNVTNQFAQIRGSVPTGLNTLEKIATSLGNDTALNTTLRGLINAASTAAANANTNANGRVARVGDTMTGDLRISKAYPILSLFYPGVEHKRLYVENDGSLIIGNGDNGRVDLRLYSSGVLNVAAHMQVGNGNAILHQDGNIQGPAWGGYLSSYVYNTAEARASAQGNAWANDRVANLQYRLVSLGEAQYFFSGTGTYNSDVPNGAVVTGFRRDSASAQYVRHRYPQVYDPVRGWVGFSNA